MTTSAAKIKVIITGATGMVGEGVLLECLQNSAISEVLLVSRKHYNAEHPRLRQLIIPDFLQLKTFTAELTSYDACFYCAGISSAGVNEADYTHITYDITLHFANTLATLNPQMSFCFVSGAQTDSSEKGRIMWARVKGKTENALMKLPFKNIFCFRPGYMKPTPGQENLKGHYKIIGALFPLLHLLFPNHGSTLQQVGVAMINSILRDYPKQILEVKDIKSLAAA